MAHAPLHRRDFLRLGGVTAAALGGGAALVGCSTGPQDEPTVQNAGVTLPSYAPYEGVQPDLEPTEDGVLAGFYEFPTDRPASTEGVPGSGGAVSALSLIFTPPFLPKGQNPYWQEFDRRLGVDSSFTVATEADFDAKLATVIASDDLPDFCQLRGVAQLPQLLEAKFADLTPYLSGDAVLEYPNLANIPTASWSAPVYNGGIYGLAVPRSTLGLVLFQRLDLFEELGLDPAFTDAAGFKRLCQDITDPEQRRWALGTYGALELSQQMHGMPNGWRVDQDGTFTAALETEERRAAIAFMKELVDAEVFHPDATEANVDAKRAFNAGQALMTWDNNSAWPEFYAANAADPTYRIGAAAPPGAAGNDPVVPMGTGSFNFTAVKQGSEDRIRELLRIANYVAAPFGTEEHTFLNYGIEGEHWTLGEDGPQVTDTAVQQTGITENYICSGPAVQYIAGRREAVDAWHQAQVDCLASGQQNPAQGLYSDTDSREGAAEGQKQADLLASIWAGRADLAEYDAYVREWQQGVGKDIKAEYAEAFRQLDESEGG